MCLIGCFKKSIIQLKPTRQYPVPVGTSCVITAEPVKDKQMLKKHLSQLHQNLNDPEFLDR